MAEATTEDLPQVSKEALLAVAGRDAGLAVAEMQFAEGVPALQERGLVHTYHLPELGETVVLSDLGEIALEKLPPEGRRPTRGEVQRMLRRLGLYPDFAKKED